MTALSSLFGRQEGRSDVQAEELARRPAFSSISPRSPAAASPDKEWGAALTSPRTGTLGPEEHAGEDRDEEEDDAEEEELVQGILNAQPAASAAAAAAAAKSRGPAAAAKTPSLSTQGGFTHMAHVAAMAASAEVGGGSVPGTSFVGSLSFVQVQMMSFIVVFSASGLVSWDDMLFAIFCTLYGAVLALWAFPLPAHSSAHLMRGPPPPIFTHSTAFKIHVAVGAVLGLFLPLSYVLGGFSQGDHESVQSATPHLFLLCCQVLTENILVTIPRCALPVRAIIPIMYNVRRLFSLADWYRNLTSHAGTTPSAAAPEVVGMEAAMGVMSGAASLENPKNWTWSVFGQFLALANLMYWSLNLLGFLIPKFLPMAFKRHFEMEREILGSEDDASSKKHY